MFSVVKKNSAGPNKVKNNIFIRKDVGKEEIISETSDREAVGTGVACLFHKRRVLSFVMTLSVAFSYAPTPSFD